jgi:hypothetical protein
MKQSLRLNLKNLPGWTTKRHIVVLECDDWGGIRMPSQEVFDRLQKDGVTFGKDRFSKFDTLAGEADLEMLFNALQSVKDSRGKPAVMTAFTSVTNPDFEKIQATGFKQYYYEPFTKTLEKQRGGSKHFQKWKDGMEAGLFFPESHGREHISVQLWMKQLQDGDENLLSAFRHGMVAVDSPGIPLPAKNFRPEFYFTSEEQMPYLKNSIREGIKVFRTIFGFTPKVFAPSNSIFHEDFEEDLAESGVKYLTMALRSAYPVAGGGLKYRNLHPGKASREGLHYYMRNCAFEPTSEDYQGLDLTLRQIEAAFRWRKPAMISTHRVNFVGGMSITNREKGIVELEKLLQEIVRRFPKVEFLSSSKALEHLSSKSKQR